jgi:virulence-associated protein VapD
MAIRNVLVSFQTINEAAMIEKLEKIKCLIQDIRILSINLNAELQSIISKMAEIKISEP